MTRQVFVTGGTGYVGRRLVAELVARGHAVRCLVRPGSERGLPPGAEAVAGNALDRATFTHAVRPGDTFVQLVGVPKPNPRKAAQFRAVDLVSARESAAAAQAAGAGHFVYVSVAHPASVMKVYQEVRMEGERMVRATGLPATFVRPWYVLGPGHRWPIALLPLYWLLERIPSTREQALRLGMVTLDDMVAALVLAVENPPEDVEIVEVPRIRGSR
ncbi:MAG TPA: NAD(P)H-binding protein, partial [Longimicrobiaceae bacterium]|nr:NAD(P)H-binding protein [Longimicrobiaceae bacterium]